MKHGGNVWEGNGPGEWLDFSANLRPEGPPEWVMAAMERAVRDARFYPDRAMRRARAGLAEYLGMPEEMVLPTAGGAAALDLALGLGRGRVAVRRDTFGEYAARAHAHGREAVEEESALAPGDTLVVCNPNNPTGEAKTREEVLALRRRAEAAGAELLVDEAFIFCCPECSARRDAGETLTVAGSLTKALAVPGIRLGYVCAGAEKTRAMERSALPWSLNALAAAVAAQLPGHEREEEADRRRNEERKARFSLALAELGARVAPSRANFLLADFGRDMEGAAAWLKGRGILVRTCASFGLGKEYLRLAVKTDAENERLIEELKAWEKR